MLDTSGLSGLTTPRSSFEFLTKPVREQDLLDAVHVALERDRIRREQTSKLNHLRVRYESLSSRHRKLLSLVTVGLLNKQIAGEMNLSETTVKVQRRILMQKLGAESLVDLTQMAGVLGVGESHLRGTKH